MRPYRGRRKDNNKWVYGFYLDSEGSKNHWIFVPEETEKAKCSWMPWLIHKVIPDTVGQFTGLKDKNGVDIYEGDKTTMVENFDDEGVYAECGTIVWDVKRCCFLWDYQNKHNEFWTLDEACPFEVIGNIHEEKP